MKKWFEPFSTAWVGVATHKLRSFLTILGIVIGVAAVISLMSIGRGATADILSHIEGMGADLIIISPKEAAPLTRPVAEAYQGGIPVIVLDREVQGDQYTAFIGADNVRIGREAGRWIRETLGGRGRIVELKGLMTSTPGQDRNQGL